jgi:hypothetical protein
VIRLNGISGVRFEKPGSEISIRVFLPRTIVILSEAKNLGSFLPQRWNE